MHPFVGAGIRRSGSGLVTLAIRRTIERDRPLRSADQMHAVARRLSRQMNFTDDSTNYFTRNFIWVLSWSYPNWSAVALAWAQRAGSVLAPNEGA